MPKATSSRRRIPAAPGCCHPKDGFRPGSPENNRTHYRNRQQRFRIDPFNSSRLTTRQPPNPLINRGRLSRFSRLPRASYQLKGGAVNRRKDGGTRGPARSAKKIRNEAAFARLAGVAPIPASSGQRLATDSAGARPPAEPSAADRDPPPPVARPHHQGLHRTARRRRKDQPRRRPAPQALPARHLHRVLNQEPLMT